VRSLKGAKFAPRIASRARKLREPCTRYVVPRPPAGLDKASSDAIASGSASGAHAREVLVARNIKQVRTVLALLTYRTGDSTSRNVAIAVETLLVRGPAGIEALSESARARSECEDYFMDTSERRTPVVTYAELRNREKTRRLAFRGWGRFFEESLLRTHRNDGR